MYDSCSSLIITAPLAAATTVTVRPVGPQIRGQFAVPVTGWVSRRQLHVTSILFYFVWNIQKPESSDFPM